MLRAKSKVICYHSTAYVVGVHPVSATPHRSRQMGQFLELGWGVTLSRGEMCAKIRELNFIGRNRLTRRTAARPTLVWCDLRGFAQSRYVVRIADLHGSPSSMSLALRSYRLYRREYA